MGALLNNQWVLLGSAAVAAFLGYHYITSANASSASSAPVDNSGLIGGNYGIAPMGGSMQSLSPDAFSSTPDPNTGKADYSLTDILAAERDANAKLAQINAGYGAALSSFGLASQFLSNPNADQFSGTFNIPGFPVSFDLTKHFDAGTLVAPANSYSSPLLPASFQRSVPVQDVAPASNPVSSFISAVSSFLSAPAPVATAAPTVQAVTLPDFGIANITPIGVTDAPAITASVPGAIASPLPVGYDPTSPADVQAAAQGASFDMTTAYRAAAGYQPAIDQLAATGQTPATLQTAPVDNSVTSAPVTLPTAPAPVPPTSITSVYDLNANYDNLTSAQQAGLDKQLSNILGYS